jgi:phage N-6-adenine-methyltransferase
MTVASNIHLVKYENARRALAEAHRVDEAKGIRDKAVAMQVYAKQAKDTQLIGYATEIRLRAERKAGELLIELRENGGRDPGGHGRRIELQTETQLPRLADLGITKTQSFRWQQLAALSEEKFEQKVDRAKSAAENSTTSAPRFSKVEFTGDTEWYTPSECVEVVRSLLGEIDLDPASSDQAQATVKAKAYFTKADDGLSKEWHGRVWLNPPYAKPYLANFMDKLVEEYSSGRVTEAVVLTHNYTDTEWFHTAAAACSAICFTRGRIKFINADGSTGSPSQGQALFYFGPNVSGFKRACDVQGFVVARIHESPSTAGALATALPEVLASVIEQLPRVTAEVDAAAQKRLSVGPDDLDIPPFLDRRTTGKGAA